MVTAGWVSIWHRHPVAAVEAMREYRAKHHFIEPRDFLFWKLEQSEVPK